MQILVVAATEGEIQSFQASRSSGEILITGIGVPATIYHLTKRLHQLDYDLVIQAGIAGSFLNDLTLGEVVLVKQDRFSDIGVWENNAFYSIFEKGLADEGEFPFRKGWLVNDNELLNRMKIKTVSSVTVNTVTDSRSQNERIFTKFNAEIESMEGAALHYVCLNERIPFLQVRSISNYTGERNEANWKMEKATENLNSTLIDLINKLVNGFV